MSSARLYQCSTLRSSQLSSLVASSSHSSGGKRRSLRSIEAVQASWNQRRSFTASYSRHTAKNSYASARAFTTTRCNEASRDSSTIDFAFFPDPTVIHPSPTPTQELAMLLSRVPIITSSSSWAPEGESRNVLSSATSTLSTLANTALSALGLASPAAGPSSSSSSSSLPSPSTSSASALAAQTTAAATLQSRKVEHNNSYDPPVMRATISSNSLDCIVLPIADASDNGATEIDFAAFANQTTRGGGVGGGGGYSGAYSLDGGLSCSSAINIDAITDAVVQSSVTTTQTFVEATENLCGGRQAVDGDGGELGRLWNGLVEDVLGPRQTAVKKA